jgi:RIP metalloprotease RseP
MKLAPEPGMVGKFINTVKGNPKKPLDVKVKRGEEILDLTVTPAEMPDGSGRIGVALAPNVKLNKIKADGPAQAIALGFKEFLALGGTVSNGKNIVQVYSDELHACMKRWIILFCLCAGLYQFVTNFQESSKNVSGPVAILAVGSEVARNDINGLYQFAALININLAIVNILPLPALDGMWFCNFYRMHWV